jgi:uncharacterized LabA/DUF88 family protein
MTFIDGENFAIRAKHFAEGRALELTVGPEYEPDVFVWMPETPVLSWMSGTDTAQLRPFATRAYYYTSLCGDAVRIDAIRLALWELGFQPEVFKREKPEEKAKGVDIALSKDLLSHAYMDNYDVAVLIAGDGDYVPLLEEVKRLGKVMYGAFFAGTGLSPQFRLACDTFFIIDETFEARWKKSACRDANEEPAPIAPEAAGPGGEPNA